MGSCVQMGTRSVGLILFAAILSGCVAEGTTNDLGGPGADAPTVAPPAQFDDTSGAVEGIVLDEEQAPIAGAQVGLLDPASNQSLMTLTDLSGRFTFSQVVPGLYQLVAQQLGYESSARAITITAGEALSVSFQLTKIAIHQGYVEVWSKRGYFQCSQTLAGSTGPCGFFPVVGNVTPISSQFNQQGSRAFIYNVSAGVVSAFNEMRWTPGSAATGTKLSLTFTYQEHEGQVRTPQHYWCTSRTESPVVDHWERAYDEKNQTDWDETEPGECLSGVQQLPDNDEPRTIDPDGMLLRSFANTGPGRNPVTGNDLCAAPVSSGSCVGLAWEQSFELWFSIFYWDRAPEGYSALADQ